MRARRRQQELEGAIEDLVDVIIKLRGSNQELARVVPELLDLVKELTDASESRWERTRRSIPWTGFGGYHLGAAGGLWAFGQPMVSLAVGAFGLLLLARSGWILSGRASNRFWRDNITDLRTKILGYLLGGAIAVGVAVLSWWLSQR